MTGFQPADQQVQIKGQSYRLRLTLGALAEISQALNAAGPKDLSGHMKTLTPQSACLMLTALLRPCHGHQIPDLSKEDLTAEQLKAAASVFEQSFRVLNESRDHG